jgi:HEAT repeat protein
MMNEHIEGILSTNIAVRKEAVRIIIKNGKNIELAEELKSIIEDGPTYAKLDALTAYGKIIEKKDVDNLLPLLKNKDWHIRAETVKCIHGILGKESFLIIEPLLKDKAYGVRSEVEKLMNDEENLSV